VPECRKEAQTRSLGTAQAWQTTSQAAIKTLKRWDTPMHAQHSHCTCIHVLLHRAGTSIGGGSGTPTGLEVIVVSNHLPSIFLASP